MSKQPIQPLELDAHNILRFRANSIVRHLLDNGGLDMNDIALIKFPVEDRIQFAQLIGYSLSGFGELNYVDDQSYDAAELMYKQGLDERDSRIKYLENTLSSITEPLRTIAANVFAIHTDDLEPSWRIKS